MELQQKMRTRRYSTPMGVAFRCFALLLILGAPFALWKALALATASPHPVVVVTSGSMLPTFHRGDVLLLSNRQTTLEVGEIPVVWFEGRDLPMVHRAIKTAWNGTSQMILTKGDNNALDDVSLYPAGQRLVRREQIVGVVKGRVPRVGWVTLALGERPWVGWMAIAALSLYSLT